MRLLVNIRLLSKGGASGVEEYTRFLIDALVSSAGPERRLVLFYPGLNKAPLPPAWLNNPYVQIINISLPNKLLDILSWLKIFRLDYFIKADVALNPHLDSFPISRLPKIQVVHDISFIHFPSFFSLTGRIWHWLQNPKSQINKASLIIVDSKFTASDLAYSLNINPAKIKVIYPGLDPSFQVIKSSSSLELTRQTLSSKYGLKNPYLLYLGSLEPRKNIIAIIRAFNIVKLSPDFKNLELVLAGGKSWLFQEIIQAVSSSPFRSQIKIIREILSSDRILLYNKAEAFLFPSFFEGFGFPPLEAQACGTPVIASNRDPLPETLSSTAIFIDPWRIQEIASTISEILLNQSLRSHLSGLGVSNSSRFNWSLVANQFWQAATNLQSFKSSTQSADARPQKKHL